MGERGLHDLGVGLSGVWIAHADRPRAGRRPAPRAAGIAEHPPRQLGKLGEILVDERVALAAEAVQAVLDVRRIARLAHLAVVNDVEPALDLSLHDLVDRSTHARRQGGGVHGHAFLAREHHPDEIVRPRQAAGMRREEPLGAALHADERLTRFATTATSAPGSTGFVMCMS